VVGGGGGVPATELAVPAVAGRLGPVGRFVWQYENDSLVLGTNKAATTAAYLPLVGFLPPVKQ
jgi:hypothetical protein